MQQTEPRTEILYDKTTAVYHRIKKDWDGYRVIIEQGGTHSSKTFSIMQVLGETAATQHKQVITVTGQDMPNLKRGALRDFEEILDSSAALRKYLKRQTSNPAVFRFHSGSIIEFVSYDTEQDAQSGKRDILFMNECDGMSYEMFKTLRIKTKNKIILDYNSKQAFWVHDHLLGQEGVIRHISNHTHNQYISPEVLKDILKYQQTDEYRWQVYGLGLTGILDDQKWLHSFNSERHIGKVPYNPKEPVFISVDFNYGKFVCIAYQCSEVDKMQGSFFHVFREFVVHNQNTQAMAQRILETFGNTMLFLTGDQTGAKHDAGYAKSTDTMLSILKDALNLSPRQMMFGSYQPKRYDKVNPSHANSWAHCNNALSLHPRFLIDPSCTELINDCRIAMIDEKKENSYQLKKGAGDGVWAMNALDCLRYAIHASLPSYRKIGSV